jgi:hypothetical protein
MELFKAIDEMYEEDGTIAVVMALLLLDLQLDSFDNAVAGTERPLVLMLAFSRRLGFCLMRFLG